MSAWTKTANRKIIITDELKPQLSVSGPSASASGSLGIPQRRTEGTTGRKTDL